MKKIVLTGGPGCGKSSLLKELASDGYTVIPESYRWLKVLELIEQDVSLKYLKSKDDICHLQTLIALQGFLEDEDIHDQYLFYDRSMLDVLAYLKLGMKKSNSKHKANLRSYLDACARNSASQIFKTFLIELPKGKIDHDWLRKDTIQDGRLIEEEIQNIYQEYEVQTIRIHRSSITDMKNQIIQCLDD